MSKLSIPIALALTLAIACVAEAGPVERLVGGPCEGCEAVFEGRPAKLAADARIAPAQEPGEPLVLTGTVRDAKGAAAAGVIVYAYHTDANGLYPPSTSRHGRLRGFAKTDAKGAFTFHTIRPLGYPKTDIPQHVHFHVVEPGRCHYYIDDLLFTDDPRLTPRQRAAHDRGRGGSGIATPTKRDGTWHVRRDIVLGANIDDYDRCSRR